MDSPQLIAHVLNRVAFGPRPEDWRHVEKVGVEAYIAEQLRPGRLSDDAVDAVVDGLETLKLDSATLLRDYPPPQRVRRMMQDDEEPDEAMLRQVALRSLVPVQELSIARLSRAIGSTRQLNEQLVDFWFNHFNVFVGKGPVRHFVIEYERDTIRPHMLGRFRDLLGSVARSPAMLVYLDNWRSGAEDGRKVAAGAPVGHGDDRDAVRYSMRRRGFGMQRVPRTARRRPAGPFGEQPGGLNENYARELLELHTLGVDGGYTQDDVREVARAFSGWTLQLTRDGGGRFVFRPDWHDAEAKTVLGERVPAGRGIEDGEAVLDILARHASTARFLATKLSRRFVADDPPESLLDKAATTFAASGGDLGATVATILGSREFHDPTYFGAKVKSPFQFLSSAARVMGVPPNANRRLSQALRELGEPLYAASAPTGYPDDAESWTSANALLARMEIGARLAEAVIQRSFTRRPPESSLSGRVDWLLGRCLPGRDTGELRAKLVAWAGQRSNEPSDSEITTLILGSPEFQRR